MNKIERKIEHLQSQPSEIREICQKIHESGCQFASLIAEEMEAEWLLHYWFYGNESQGQILVHTSLQKPEHLISSISLVIHAADWHEREIEDLFGLVFEDHPKLGDFILHENWPEGFNPMRKGFNPQNPYPFQELTPVWNPRKIVHAQGSFLMPVGPVYGGEFESSHFLLETVGEDVIHTIRRLFYKYRGVEKIAENKTIDQVLQLSERYAGTSAFAHSLAFCQTVEQICGIKTSERTAGLRVFLAELERIRHHIGTIEKICESTGLGIAGSQTSLLHEDCLRLTGELTGHRYFFRLNTPGGLRREFTDRDCAESLKKVQHILKQLFEIETLLKRTSSFLDRLEEVGIVTLKNAEEVGLVGPAARASGVKRDLRTCQSYGLYDQIQVSVPCETQGDGYARLRLLFSEIRESFRIMEQILKILPKGSGRPEKIELKDGTGTGWVEAPLGAEFQWVRISENGKIARYRISSPSFANWHGFDLATENFAFQDFPIIMATFGLSVAECDR